MITASSDALDCASLLDLLNTLNGVQQSRLRAVLRLAEDGVDRVLAREPRNLSLAFRVRRKFNRLVRGVTMLPPRVVWEMWRSSWPIEPTYRAWVLLHESHLIRLSLSSRVRRPPVHFCVIIRDPTLAHLYDPLLRSISLIAEHDDSVTVYTAMDHGRLSLDHSVAWCIKDISCLSDSLQSCSDEAYVTWLEQPGIISYTVFHRIAELLSLSTPSVIYCDEDVLVDGVRATPFFKPEFAPTMLRSTNYFSGLTLYRGSLVHQLKFVTHPYELALGASSRAPHIVRIPEVAFHADPRLPVDRTAELTALRRFFGDDMAVRVEPTQKAGIYRLRRRLSRTPGVVVIIPSRDNTRLLSACIDSLTVTNYPHFEVLVVDNGSRELEAINFFERLSSRYRVVHDPIPFNFSQLMNHAVAVASQEIVVFLNDDTEIIDPDWLGALVDELQDPNIGAVGGLLLYPDGKVQHGGIIVGLRGSAGNAFRFQLPDACYHDYAFLTRETSAVTAACMAIRRSTFQAVGGFDEQLGASFNDTDLCLRLNAAGLRTIFSPYARVMHRETSSRPQQIDENEVALFRDRWATLIAQGDRYYNPNLSLLSEWFEPRV